MIIQINKVNAKYQGVLAISKRQATIKAITDAIVVNKPS